MEAEVVRIAPPSSPYRKTATFFLLLLSLVFPLNFEPETVFLCVYCYNYFDLFLAYFAEVVNCFFNFFALA